MSGFGRKAGRRGAYPVPLRPIDVVFVREDVRIYKPDTRLTEHET